MSLYPIAASRLPEAVIALLTHFGPAVGRKLAAVCVARRCSATPGLVDDSRIRHFYAGLMDYPIFAWSLEGSCRRLSTLERS